MICGVCKVEKNETEFVNTKNGSRTKNCQRCRDLRLKSQKTIAARKRENAGVPGEGMCLCNRCHEIKPIVYNPTRQVPRKYCADCNAKKCEQRRKRKLRLIA